jgi:hypothetical protein
MEQMQRVVKWYLFVVQVLREIDRSRQADMYTDFFLA